VQQSGGQTTYAEQPYYVEQQSYGQSPPGYGYNQQQGHSQYSPPPKPDAEPPRPHVSLWKAYKLFWKNYAKASGRASRTEYWGAYLFNMLFSIAVQIPAYILQSSNTAISNALFAIAGIYGFAIFCPAICIAIRRLHDSGKSGFYLFLILIPFAGAIVYLVLMCLPPVNNASNPWHKDATQAPTQSFQPQQ